MLLEDKNTVIYGGGGSVARAVGHAKEIRVLGGTVEYLIVMQEGARAHLVAEGSDHMEDLGSRTAQEGLDDHLNFAERFEEDWRRILEEDLRRNVSEDISRR